MSGYFIWKMKQLKTVLIVMAVATLSLMAACSGTNENLPAGTDGQVEVATDTVQTGADKLNAIIAAIKANPNDANNYYKRALYLRERGKLDMAIKDLDRALAIDSTVAVFHLEIGNIFYDLGKPDEARYAFEACLRYDDQNVDAYVKLAQIFFVFKRYGEAMDNINNALRIDDYTAEGYYLKGWIYKETGDTAKAVSSFNTAREINPDFYDAHLQVGLLYATAHSDLAVEYYDAALAVRPQSVEALYAKGLYCQNHGYFDTAFQCYKAIADIDPTYAYAYFNQGFIYMNYVEELDSAVHYFGLAINAYPDYYEAYHNRGVCFELNGMREEAIADYRRALSIKGDYDPPARALQKLGV